jgi:hypothetical protein
VKIYAQNEMIKKIQMVMVNQMHVILGLDEIIIVEIENIVQI